jgi:hypothetical protein
MRAPRSFALLALAAAAMLVVACGGNPLGLPAARFGNVVDTVSLWALDGTPLNTPSAYRIRPVPSTIRTDLSTDFDFAFNITPTGQAVLLPTGAVGLGRQSGIRVESLPFDSITAAATSGYQDSVAVAVDSGTIAVVRSRPTQCEFGLVVFYYAKLVVVRVDPVARRIDYHILVDQNCGYRGLEPGLPKR